MSKSWRLDPRFKDLLHPDHPDDLQVIVHDGGPRLTKQQPELIWVTLIEAQGEVFRGRLINQPHQLPKLSLGSEIQFLIDCGADHPLMVSEKYLKEREEWRIHPCEGCGLSELFDPPSELIQALFPAVPDDAEMTMFTTRCPICGAAMGVESKLKSPQASAAVGAENKASPGLADKRSKRPWWKFWA